MVSHAAYAEEAQDERLLAFIDHMERWRTLSRRHGVTDLLWDIYESQDYVNYVAPCRMVSCAARMYSLCMTELRAMRHLVSVAS